MCLFCYRLLNCLPAQPLPCGQPATKIPTTKQAATTRESHGAVGEASISGAISLGLFVQAVWIVFLEFVESQLEVGPS